MEIKDLSVFQKPILNVSGYMGAGKTTLMIATLKQLKGQRRVSYVLNDGRVAGGQTVDSKRLKGLADLQTVADECFGCRNAEQLLAFIESRLTGNRTDIIIIEGFGFTDGFEVPLLLKRRLNLETGVFTVVKTTTYNLFHRAPTFPSQIRAANLGIGMTNTFHPFIAEKLKECIGQLNGTTPIYEIDKDQAVPPHVLDWLRGDGIISDKNLMLGAVCLERFNIDLHHHHDHHHGQFVLNRELAPTADAQELMKFLGKFTPAERIKFNLGSWHYNKTGDDPWAEPEAVEDDGQNHLTIYSVVPLVTRPIEHLLIPKQEIVELGDTKKSMRGAELAPKDLTPLMINGLAELPDEPVMVDNYPLLFEEKIIWLGELLHNPSSGLVDQELVRKVINRRVQYFVKCAETALPGSPAWDNPGFATGKLYCAIAPAWFYVRELEKLERELAERIERLPIARFFAAGLMQVTEFSPNNESASMFLVELENTIRYTGICDPEIQKGLAHLHDLAKNDGRAFLGEGVERLMAS